MKKIIIFTSGLILMLLIMLTLISIIHPKEEPRTYPHRPIPTHSLQTTSGEKVQIKEQFPNQDYLLLFLIENSPTSLSQLAELMKIIDSIPPELTIILIHLGQINFELPHWVSKRLILLIDPEAQLAQAIKIRTVPTLLLLQNSELEIVFAERLVPAEKLITYITLLKEARKQPPSL